MSWRATAHVKPLHKHPDGSRLTAREKLILFVLADSHNEDYGYAWPSVDKAAFASLTSRSRFIELVGRMESKGTIRVQREIGKSNRYFFPGLPVQELDPPAKRPVRKLDPTRPIAVGPHPSDSCRTQAFIEPSVTDIPAGTPVLSLPKEEKTRVLAERLDDYYKRKWKTDEEGRKFLISPSSGDRLYEESFAKQ